ncbi:MAG: hypothetical protein KAQ98_11015 [Bacteriovoracaceae bacterium]|nr:hypothetical protein [Bacteriovoracaceae bacterium]
MNLTNMLDYNSLRKLKGKIKNIFFYRICGTGMGACACLLKESGYNIEGGDNFFAPPMSDYLKKTGIACHKLSEISDKYLEKFDLIVVGNVVPKNSDDATRIENDNIPFASFPSVLGAFVLNDINTVGIAGTHGKTTTTYFMAQLFEKLGMNPGYFVGGVIEGRAPSSLGDGNYFFIESDEYDSAYFEKISKFRMYSLNHLILTSLEFDHADIYNNVEDIKDQFRAIFPDITKSYLINHDYVAAKELWDEFKKTGTEKKWFHYGEKTDIGPEIITADKTGTTFSLVLNGNKETFFTSLIGLHNILNISTCIIFAHSEGFSVDKIGTAVKNMEMVKRRQEERGYFKGALFVDDFAHHPRAVALTIDAVKIKYPGKDIHIVIEPHSSTARSNIFQKEFADSLRGDHCVIVVKPSKSTTVKDCSNLDCNKLVNDLRGDVKIAIIIDNQNELVEYFKLESKENSLFLILSNGTCAGFWQSDFVRKFLS